MLYAYYLLVNHIQFPKGPENNINISFFPMIFQIYVIPG